MIYWSNTKLEDAITCMYSLFLVYFEKVPRIMTAPLAAGLFVHNGCRKFNDPREDRPHFTSALSYAGRRVGSWKQFVAKNKVYGNQPIVEDFDGQVWALSESAIRPCSERFYEMFVEREKPAAVERHFRIQIGDFILGGSFDVIDQTLCFLDYKTGKHEPREVALRADYQFTIYSAALPVLVAHDENLRSRLHLTEGEQKTLENDPLKLMDVVQGKYVHLRSGKVFETRRTQYDLIELLNTIESVALRAEQGDFAHSRGNHCAFCKVRQKCDHDRLEGRILTRADLAKVTGTYVLFPPRRELKVYTGLPTNVRLLEDRYRKRHVSSTVIQHPLFPDLH